jgi:hypothetical protein
MEPKELLCWTMPKAASGSDAVSTLVKHYSRDQFAAEFLSLSSRFPNQNQTFGPATDLQTTRSFDLKVGVRV